MQNTVITHNDDEHGYCVTWKWNELEKRKSKIKHTIPRQFHRRHRTIEVDFLIKWIACLCILCIMCSTIKSLKQVDGFHWLLLWIVILNGNRRYLSNIWMYQKLPNNFLSWLVLFLFSIFFISLIVYVMIHDALTASSYSKWFLEDHSLYSFFVLCASRLHPNKYMYVFYTFFSIVIQIQSVAFVYLVSTRILYEMRPNFMSITIPSPKALNTFLFIDEIHIIYVYAMNAYISWIL